VNNKATTKAARTQRNGIKRKIHVSDALLLEAISAVGRELSKVREYLVWRHLLEFVPRGVGLSVARPAGSRLGGVAR
jgi:hypothetical protein